MRLLIATALMCTVGTVAALAIAHFGPQTAGIGIAIVAAICWAAADLPRGIRAALCARRRVLTGSSEHTCGRGDH